MKCGVSRPTECCRNTFDDMARRYDPASHGPFSFCDRKLRQQPQLQSIVTRGAAPGNEVRHPRDPRANMRLLIDQAGLRSSLFAVATFSPVQILCFAAFLAAGGAIVYVLFGYPLLLGWIAKRHNHPVKKDDQLRSVSIIIAVRNGEKFIRRKLESVLALNYPHCGRRMNFS